MYSNILYHLCEGCFNTVIKMGNQFVIKLTTLTESNDLSHDWEINNNDKIIKCKNCGMEKIKCYSFHCDNFVCCEDLSCDEMIIKNIIA